MDQSQSAVFFVFLPRSVCAHIKVMWAISLRLHAAFIHN